MDVLDAAAADAEERRREAGVAIGTISGGWEGGSGRDQLSIRHPVVDDSTNREIGEHGAVGACKTGRRSTGGEHPVALPGSNRINGDKLLAFVVPENAQVHVIQPRKSVGADQCPHHLHDLHQDFSPGLEDGDGFDAESAEDAADGDLGGSGSQWSMMPTIVRSLG